MEEKVGPAMDRIRTRSSPGDILWAMSISSATSKASYSGNGVTTVFAFAYKFELNADLVVTLVPATGAGVVKSLTTHYTLTGAGTDAGGNVTMLVAPANGETLVIERTVAATQALDFSAQGPFSPETHEKAFDKVTALCQQLIRRILVLEQNLLQTQSAPTDYSAVGRMYLTTAGVLKVCTVAGNPGTWVSVGAQT